MNKHYNNEYLKDTGKVLQYLKEYSYDHFKYVNKGVIVDLGCGNGTDVHRMSELLSESVKIIGVDNDPKMINLAKKTNNSPKNKIVNFILSNAEKLPFHDFSIDGLRSERLIQHLDQPEKVIHEIHRVLKNNSPLVVIETDWQSISLYNEHIDIEKRITQYLTEEKVINGFAAKKFLMYLINQGFKNIKIKVFPVTLNSLKEVNKYLKIETILEEIKNKHYINKEEFTKYRNTLREYDRLNCFSCSMNVIAITAIK